MFVDNTSTDKVAGGDYPDEEREAASKIVVDPKSKRNVLKVHDRREATMYNSTVLIYDYASTVHLTKNLDMFEGEPRPVDDDEVSFVGFDTSSGHAFPVARGKLKFPPAGISAFYSPHVVGNIIRSLCYLNHITSLTKDVLISQRTQWSLC